MDTLNIAHRGFSGYYLENTMKAFQEAWEAGADGMELDVQLTADREVAVFHDASLDRLASRGESVEDYTLKELTDILLPSGLEMYTIPILDEYLKWAQSRRILTNIELKSITSENKGLEEKVIEKVYEYGQEEAVMLSSFHKNSIRRVKEINQRVECGLLTPSCSEKILYLTKEMGAEYIHPHFTSIDSKLVKLAGEMELGVTVWTVNTEEEIKKQLDYGVMGIITDYPNILHKIQKETSLSLK